MKKENRISIAIFLLSMGLTAWVIEIVNLVFLLYKNPADASLLFNVVMVLLGTFGVIVGTVVLPYP